MKKAINKSNSIRETTETYENDPNLFQRRAAILYNVHHTSITNYLTNKIKPTSDYFVIYQMLTPIEENILK
jgi:hypothetical protein